MISGIKTIPILLTHNCCSSFQQCVCVLSSPSQRPSVRLRLNVRSLISRRLSVPGALICSTSTFMDPFLRYFYTIRVLIWGYTSRAQTRVHNLLPRRPHVTMVIILQDDSKTKFILSYSVVT